MHILVVDDSPDSLALMKLELELLGHEVTTAEHADEALEVASRESPDLLISDLRLPDIDGFDLIHRIRQLPRMRAVPAIAVTGLSRPADVEEALLAGFDGHLVKPIDVGELWAELERVTRRKAREAR